MINLIRNELTKIFRKKGLYIILIITLVFVIASNLIYKFEGENVEYGPWQDIEYYEESLKLLNPEDKNEVDTYVSIKNELDVAKLINKYGDNQTWQSAIIYEKVYPIITQMNYYQYEEKNEKEYENEKSKYDEFIKKLDTNDWEYFAKQDLDEVQKSLKVASEHMKTSSERDKKLIEEEINELKIQEQVLKWRLEKDIIYGYDYKNQCLNSWKTDKLALNDYEEKSKNSYEGKLQYYETLERVAINEYDIVHDVESGNYYNARGILLNLFDEFELFIIIMIVMIAGSIVSEEFSKGTIKLLLIKPYKRTTILASKFITCVVILLVFILIVTFMQYVVGGIIYGFNNYDTPAIIYNHNTNQIEEISIPSYLFMQAIAKLPQYMLLMALAFSLSVIFTSTPLAITIGLLGFMGSPIVNTLGITLKLWWLKFFVTPNWDLRQYLYGGLPEFEGITLPFSIAICVIYMLILLIPTIIIFKKKNIKNV